MTGRIGWRGDRLRALRESRNCSRETLAVLPELRVTAYTISNYENGETSPSFAAGMALARYFDVEPGYLGGLVDIPGKFPIPKTLRS